MCILSSLLQPPPGTTEQGEVSLAENKREKLYDQVREKGEKGNLSLSRCRGGSLPPPQMYPLHTQWSAPLHEPSLAGGTEEPDFQPQGRVDLLLRVTVGCSGHGTGHCQWSHIPFQSSFPSYRHSVLPQRMCHCSMFYPHMTQCCKTWNIPLTPVLGLTKELIELHTFPKSCINSSQAQPPLSQHKLHSFLRYTKTNKAQDKRVPCTNPGNPGSTLAEPHLTLRHCQSSTTPTPSFNITSNYLVFEKIEPKNSLKHRLPPAQTLLSPWLRPPVAAHLETWNELLFPKEGRAHTTQASTRGGTCPAPGSTARAALRKPNPAAGWPSTHPTALQTSDRHRGSAQPWGWATAQHRLGIHGFRMQK